MKNIFYNPIQFYSLLVSIAILTLIGCAQNKEEAKEQTPFKKDSIEIWLEQSNSRKLTPDERRKVLVKAYQATTSTTSDSLKLNQLKDISYQADFLNNNRLLKEVNDEYLNLATKLKDTSNIGEAHWNYGIYFSKKEILDKAYYHFHKAYQNFKAVKNEKYTARMLYNLGLIQSKIKDYTGSEISIFEAIAIFNKLENRYLDLYSCYNLLGLVYMEYEEYDKAIFYHHRAWEYLNKVEDKNGYEEGHLNNLGIVYQKQQNYNKAIESFNAALANKNLKKQNIYSYARCVDNLAYTRFLNGDTTNVSKDLNYALHIRDSAENLAGTGISKSHLSEFYAAKTDTFKAIQFAKEAYNLAYQVKNNRDQLKTLKLLSKVDKSNASTYLKEYVHLSDSLKVEERKTRNKFTRLRYETDEYIQETQKLSQETQKLSQQKIWISIGSFIVIFFLVAAYIILAQRSKNKELVFEREQQKANEEIFSLMLKQQSKLEEGRMKERYRISEDLHDGILGKIFGARLGLGFLNIKADEATTKKLEFFTDELQSIEKEIRTISHELKNEILSSKEDFFKIIEDLIKQKSTLGECEYAFNYNDKIDWDEINDAIKINFYRITQEAFQNIIKYAKASEVEVSIDLEDDQLFLTIKDNGIGFKPNEKRKGIGLKNMRSRTKKINGTIKIESQNKKGTTIVVSCPIIT